MDAFLQLSAEDRRLLCEEAAGRRGLPAPVIEKDFWVCWTLRELFRLPNWDGQLTFKGGTSLSKGWGIIARFSEDIDVTISRAFLGFGDETMNKSQWKKLRDTCPPHVQEQILPALAKRFQELMPGDFQWRLVPADEAEDATRLTLLFYYPTVFAGTSGYVTPTVRLEFGGRTDTEPIETPTITPCIAEDFPVLLPNSSFKARTVAARRTFWEKAMLLHEEKLRPAEQQRKPRLARHYYDLYCLIEHGVARQAVEDEGLFQRVAEHRQLVFGLKWVNYSTLRRGSLNMIPSMEQLPDWLADYAAMREAMFFDDPPAFDEILQVVKVFQDKFNGVPAGTVEQLKEDE